MKNEYDAHEALAARNERMTRAAYERLNAAHERLNAAHERLNAAARHGNYIDRRIDRPSKRGIAVAEIVARIVLPLVMLAGAIVVIFDMIKS